MQRLHLQPAIIAPFGSAATFASKFGQFWVRLKYNGNADPPSRDCVRDVLLFESSDIYSFIAPSNRKDFKLCFTSETSLRCFLQIQASKAADPKWKDWSVEMSIQMDTTTLVVKFWTGRVSDEGIDLYLPWYCEITAFKPVDKFGIWYGVCKYRIRIEKHENAHLIQIHNSMSLGPYPGHIIYPGLPTSCSICVCGTSLARVQLPRRDQAVDQQEEHRNQPTDQQQDRP